MRASLLNGVYRPLSEDGSALIVDTTDLEQFDYQKVLQIVRPAVSAAR